jgi:hypothetical protein
MERAMLRVAHRTESEAPELARALRQVVAQFEIEPDPLPREQAIGFNARALLSTGFGVDEACAIQEQHPALVRR